MDVHEGQGCFYAFFMLGMFVLGALTFPFGIAIWVLLFLIYKNTRRV